ncbi:MAG: DUF4190 domain-containing protein [Akkermansiaceae bacterium]|nr:DUF4190 domain-containing protein [Akkermansiaceae bacterium]
MASLICGIGGIITCGISSLVGVVLGHLALSDIKKTGRSGKGLAVAGVLTSYFFLVIGGVATLASIAVPAVMRAKQRAEQVETTVRMTQLHLQLEEFKAEFNEYPSLKTQRELAQREGLPFSAEVVEPFGQLEAALGLGVDPLIAVPKSAKGDWIYWVYEGGSEEPDRPVLLSPEIGDRRMLLKGDGSVEKLNEGESPTPSTGTQVTVPAPRR